MSMIDEAIAGLKAITAETISSMRPIAQARPSIVTEGNDKMARTAVVGGFAEDTPKKDVVEFLQISNLHRKAKHSFVIVTDKIKLDDIPDKLVIVPTIQEAYDIIEMEEIERDLGF